MQTVPSIITEEEDIFADLLPEQRSLVEQQIRYRAYPANRLLYTPEDRAEKLYILRYGRVRLYMCSPEGRVLTLRALGSASIFGEISSTDQLHYDSFAETVTACIIGELAREDVQLLLAHYPAIGVRLMRLIDRRLRRLERVLSEMAFKSVPQRLATLLLNLLEVNAEEGGGEPAIVRCTHQQLADMIGAYRETVTKTIGAFRERGLIQVAEETIFLIDLARLRALAS